MHIGYPTVLSSECVDISARPSDNTHTVLVRHREIHLVRVCIVNRYHKLRRGDPIPSLETQSKGYGVSTDYILFGGKKHELPDDFWSHLRKLSYTNRWGVAGIVPLYEGSNNFYAGFSWHNEILHLCRISHREHIMQEHEYQSLVSAISRAGEKDGVPTVIGNGIIIAKKSKGMILRLLDMDLRVSDNPHLYERV